MPFGDMPFGAEPRGMSERGVAPRSGGNQRISFVAVRSEGS